MKPYYDREGITIYCGDCLEVMPQLDITVDAIIADNPYGTTACSWDSVIPLEPMWAEYKRLIKRNGAVVLFGSQPFTSMLVMSNLEWFRDEWIWEKDIGGSPALAENHPMRYHENIIIFSQKACTYNPQKWDAGFISNKPGKNSYLGMAGKKIKGHIKHLQSTQRYPKSIIKFNKPKSNTGGLHPTQKPLKLLCYLTRTYTNPGELVLDNAMGSGTTLLAARAEGRRAIGIDIDEHWCKVAVERLSNEKTYSLPNGKTYKQVSFLPDGN